jgi:hypothetical protein
LKALALALGRLTVMSWPPETILNASLLTPA